MFSFLCKSNHAKRHHRYSEGIYSDEFFPFPRGVRETVGKSGPHSKMRPAVNFINVKRANFTYKCHLPSYVLALSKNPYIKR